MASKTRTSNPEHEKSNEDIDKKYAFQILDLSKLVINFTGRRLRNRLAQRAFRRRQADRLRTLLDRADSSDRPYDETIEALQDENSRLRKNLIEVQTKLARLVATMQTLTGTVTDALEYPSHGVASNIDHEEPEPAPGPEPEIEPEAKQACNNSMDLDLGVVSKLDSADYSVDALDNDNVVSTKSFDNRDIETGGIMVDLSSPATKLAASFDNLAQQIPSIWSFEYQIGLDPYTNAMATSENSTAAIRRGWNESNSPFSDHINVLQRLMKGKIERTSRPTISL